MKNIKQLLAFIAAVALAASAWAQSADDAYKAVNDQLVAASKNAKPNGADFPQMSKAVVDCLAAYPGDKRAMTLVNDTLNYGLRLQQNKMNALAQNWYLHLQNGILDKQIEPNVSPEGKDALTALIAATSEGEMKLTPTADNLNAWRDKLDKLLATQAGAPFVLDRERIFYLSIANSTNPAYRKLASDRLTQLSQHKDKNISGWANQELKCNEIRQAPFTLSVTTIDGKNFDTAKLKGPPLLYLWFWSIGDRKAEDDLKKIADIYGKSSRKQLEILAVCTDPDEKRDDVNALIKKNKLPFPVYFDGKGKKGDLYEKFGIQRTPIGFIVDRKGTLGPTDFKYGDLAKSTK